MNNLTNTVLATVLICFVLVYLKAVLVPFVFAIMIYFLINEVRFYLRKYKLVNGAFPLWLQNAIAFFAICGFLSLLTWFASSEVDVLIEQMPTYQNNLMSLEPQINRFFGFDAMQYVRVYLEDSKIDELMQQTIRLVAILMGNFLLIILYVIFILAENGLTKQKINKMFSQQQDIERINSILSKINRSISRFITLKTLVSAITAVLSYVLLLLLGIDFPVLWAVIIFILNFIPALGAIVGTFLPAFMGLVQYADFKPFILVLFSIGLIQAVVGNYLEPKLMGNTLNISPLVVLLSLAFGSLIWGFEGMVLCVPVTGILIIILSHFHTTRKIAVLLSEKGDV